VGDVGILILAFRGLPGPKGLRRDDDQSVTVFIGKRGPEKGKKREKGAGFIFYQAVR
jgi:hypothetical protein